MHHVASELNRAPELKPTIHEILRTCVHPTSVILRIVRIIRKERNDDELEVKKQKDSTCITKLFLSDGELIIQGLLHKTVATFVNLATLRVGDLLEVYKFKIKKAQRDDGNGKVVFIGIEDCKLVHSEHKAEVQAIPLKLDGDEKTSQENRGSGRYISRRIDRDKLSGDFNSRLRSSSTYQDPCDGVREVDAVCVNPDTKLASNLPTVSESSKQTESEIVNDGCENLSKAQPKPLSNKVNLKRRILDEHVSDEDGTFETITTNVERMNKRRTVLHDIDQNTVWIHRDSSPCGTMEDEIDSAASDSENLQSRSKLPPLVGEKQDLDEKLSTAITRMESTETTNSTASEETKVNSASSATIESETSTSTQTPTPTAKTQPPFHDLYSLISSKTTLPRKSYHLSTLAIIKSVSPHLIYARPGTRFPPKRLIKITDSSLINHKHINEVYLAVYDNAADFKPEIGTLALFRDVVMQRIGGGGIMLNIYPRIKKRRVVGESDLDENVVDGSRSLTTSTNSATHVDGSVEGSSDDWFITDINKIKDLGYDVCTMLEWIDNSKK